MQLVKDVTGASYFVCNVDVEDGVPSIKLPYNCGQDPWYVAQDFIHKTTYHKFITIKLLIL